MIELSCGTAQPFTWQLNAGWSPEPFLHWCMNFAPGGILINTLCIEEITRHIPTIPVLKLLFFEISFPPNVLPLYQLFRVSRPLTFSAIFFIIFSLPSEAQPFNPPPPMTFLNPQQFYS